MFIIFMFSDKMLSAFMMSGIILIILIPSVITVNGIMPTVAKLGVVAPKNWGWKKVKIYE